MTNKQTQDWVQAGDNTLHGAIDHWQGEAARLKAENEALRVERDKALARAEELQRHYDKKSSQFSRFGAIMGELNAELVCGDESDSDPIPASLWALWRETPAQSVAHIKAAGAREALQRAMQTPNFSGTVVRVDALWAVIEQMEGES